ncbi:MAG: chromate transporter [Bacillota bacterium]
MNKIKLQKLFLIFLEIGGFTFGGGYAMLPLLEEELVVERNWLTEEEFLDIFAIVQGIPGIIAINSSLFIGYKLQGIAGALTAVAGISLPSIVIITLITEWLLNLQHNIYITGIFMGIRTAVVILILWAAYKMGSKAIIEAKSLLYTGAMIIGVLYFKLSPIILIAAAGIIGIILKQGEQS